MLTVTRVDDKNEKDATLACYETCEITMINIFIYTLIEFSLIYDTLLQIRFQFEFLFLARILLKEKYIFKEKGKKLKLSCYISKF